MATDIPVVKFGAALSFVNATATMEYANDGKTLVHVENTSGASVNVTHVEKVACSWDHALQNVVDAAPAGGITQVWRGWQIRRFNRPDHKAEILLSATTSVRVAAVSYP